MSRHWKPDNDIVRGPWGSAEDYLPRRGGGGGGCWRPYVKLLLIVFAAVCLGLVAAVLLQRRAGPEAEARPSAAIEWDAVQAVPRRAPDAADLEWERRSAAVDDPQPASAPSGRDQAIRAAFGYCHSGGGTNCVVDGDTFYVNGAKVRIAGIDAPETHPPRCAAEARLGNEATERLHALLNSGSLTMTSIDRDRDRYGRLLRNVAVSGRDVGEAMIAAGVARAYGSGRRSWCG
jgi:endonuclease YncB( thermonuclease family)